MDIHGMYDLCTRNLPFCMNLPNFFNTCNLYHLCSDVHVELVEKPDDQTSKFLLRLSSIYLQRSTVLPVVASRGRKVWQPVSHMKDHLRLATDLA